MVVLLLLLLGRHAHLTDAAYWPLHLQMAGSYSRRRLEQADCLRHSTRQCSDRNKASHDRYAQQIIDSSVPAAEHNWSHLNVSNSQLAPGTGLSRDWLQICLNSLLNAGGVGFYFHECVLCALKISSSYRNLSTTTDVYKCS